jgi:hypothetical protein
VWSKTPHGRTVGCVRPCSHRLKSCAIRTSKVLEKKRRTAGQDATWKFGSPNPTEKTTLREFSIRLFVSVSRLSTLRKYWPRLGLLSTWFAVSFPTIIGKITSEQAVRIQCDILPDFGSVPNGKPFLTYGIWVLPFKRGGAASEVFVVDRPITSESDHRKAKKEAADKLRQLLAGPEIG